ncbi:hypothetical protein ISF_03637 [Cordyceps fumosorosea ARSEF 2679]|uniref:Uncharacterized protein n=1 Tax=Cordyceps fumosorosea (strain ARSEF 2679) TaxID=1081104 RepID=A0A167ZFR0_CORFA|nr:hypothetical protein ISF_03637 [Cordyceps fumosorosea ARSEF 2679]OAA67461.1 hypothetical protein ISF_03637 [Cordyceps fumosorosea ARSEF 2679]
MRLTAYKALSNVHYPPDIITHGVVDEYLGPCGYTIDRTEYSFPGSDQLWHSLLRRLDADFRQEIYVFQHHQHIPREREATEKLISLVRFDGRPIHHSTA